jgi:hypothetical protein
MTVFGKILVFVNLALSVLLMFWALAVWTNRIDFSDTKPTADQVAGELFKRKEVVKTLWDGVPSAQVAWRGSRDAIARKEAQQAADWDFYHAEIAHNLGKANAAAPCREVRFAPADNPELGVRKGLVDVNPKTNLPLMEDVKDRNGQGLQSLAYYRAEVEKTLATLTDVQKRYKDQVNEAVALTDKLIGPKGLQQRLLDEKQKREDIVAEEKLVTPLLINTVVESALIVKRHNQLELRKKELQKVGVAAGGR